MVPSDDWSRVQLVHGRRITQRPTLAPARAGTEIPVRVLVWARRAHEFVGKGHTMAELITTL